MTLSVEPLSIPDVLLVTPRRFADSRGYFVETYTQRSFHAAGITTEFRQDNQSLSTQRGTVRGLHFQLAPEPQTKLVRVLAGSVFDVCIPASAAWSARRAEELRVAKSLAQAFSKTSPASF